MTRRDSSGPSGADAFRLIEDGLGNLASAIRRAVDEIASLKDAAPREGETEERHQSPLRASFDLRVGGVRVSGTDAADDVEQDPSRVRPKRKPAQTRRGPVQPASTMRRPAPDPEPRDPHVEVHDNEDAWTVIAELPGVAPDEIEVDTRDGKLLLRTNGARRFSAVLDVPEGLAPDAPDVRLSNGILEIRLSRKAT